MRLVITLLTAAAALPAAAQGPACDISLRPRSQSEYAYGPRGDRCEGLFVKRVGGTILSVASLTSSFEKYDLKSAKRLRFEWGGPADSGLRIRVRGIRPNLYYGMDAVRPADATSYEWPISMLSSLNIGQADLGALAWTRRPTGGQVRNVYVPLRITQADTSTATTGYTLVLFPGVKLQEVFVTLGPADSAGHLLTDRLLKDHEPQRQRRYPAKRPIRVKILPLEPGLYHLEVSATVQGGSPVEVPPLLFDTSLRPPGPSETHEGRTPSW
jgi:hypothetical protein